MADFNETTELINQNYKENQKNKIRDYLIENGVSPTIAEYKAQDLVFSGNVTYNDFIEGINDSEISFKNSVLQENEEQNQIIVDETSVKTKNKDINKIFKTLKRLGAGALIVAVTTTAGFSISNIHKEKVYDEKVTDIARSIEDINNEARDDYGKFSSLNQEAGNLVAKNKYIEIGADSYPIVYVNYDKMADDLINICDKKPEFFEGLVYSVYTNIYDVGLENESPSKEQLKANELYHMDSFVEALASKVDSNSPIHEYFVNCHTFPTLAFEMLANRDPEIYNKYGSAVEEYEKIKSGTDIKNIYLNLADSSQMDEMLALYSKEMNKEIHRTLDDVKDYEQELEEGISYGR